MRPTSVLIDVMEPTPKTIDVMEPVFAGWFDKIKNNPIVHSFVHFGRSLIKLVFLN